MPSFTRHTEATILASLREVYGSGWENDTVKLTAVKIAIYSAWVNVKLRAASPAAITATSHPTWADQLWYYNAMFLAGMHIAPEGQAVALFARMHEALLKDLREQRLAGEGTYSYDGP